MLWTPSSTELLASNNPTAISWLPEKVGQAVADPAPAHVTLDQLAYGPDQTTVYGMLSAISHYR